MLLAMLLCGCGSEASKPASDEATAKSDKPVQVKNDSTAKDVPGQVTFLVKAMTDRLSIF